MCLRIGKRIVRYDIQRNNINFDQLTLSIRTISMHVYHLFFHPCVMNKEKNNTDIRRRCAKARPGASFTVEAAFVLPLFLFAILVMLGLFASLQVQSCMAQALQYSARKAAVSYTEHDAADQGTGLIGARRMAVGYFRDHGGWTDMIAGGMAGVSFLGSDLSGDYVSLQASYRVRLPVSVWGIRSLPVTQCVCARKWIGATENADGSGEDGDGYVYVTEYGTVYHTSTACPYLDLSIHAVTASGVKTMRNLDGGKYYACSCYKKGDGNMVYITDYGTEYHSRLSCSHLTRTIHRVQAGETGTLHACPKCAGGG